MSNGAHAALLIEDVIKSINRLSDRIGSLERRMGAAETPAITGETITMRETLEVAIWACHNLRQSSPYLGIQAGEYLNLLEPALAALDAAEKEQK